MENGDLPGVDGALEYVFGPLTHKWVNIRGDGSSSLYLWSP